MCILECDRCGERLHTAFRFISAQAATSKKEKDPTGHDRVLMLSIFVNGRVAISSNPVVMPTTTIAMQTRDAHCQPARFASLQRRIDSAYSRGSMNPFRRAGKVPARQCRQQHLVRIAAIIARRRVRGSGSGWERERTGGEEEKRSDQSREDEKARHTNVRRSVHSSQCSDPLAMSHQHTMRMQEGAPSRAAAAATAPTVQVCQNGEGERE